MREREGVRVRGLGPTVAPPESLSISLEMTVCYLLVVSSPFFSYTKNWEPERRKLEAEGGSAQLLPLIFFPLGFPHLPTSSTNK